MKPLLGVALALAAIGAGAQTTNFSQVQHIETSLNHLTVIDLGEPVLTLAIADRDAFQVERHDDKVFLMPLREGISTNLFVWTASRQVSYEIDPAGDLAKMNVVVRNAPQPAQHATSQSTQDRQTPSDEEIRKIASLVLTQALMGTEDIARESSKTAASTVNVELEQVFRSKDSLYLRYTISNLSPSPFRITTPDVNEPLPTEQPISLLSLRDRQLSPQAFAAFKATPGASVPVVSAESQVRDLAPGQKATGVVSIRGTQGDPPQLYQLHFGNSQTGAVTVEVVL